MGLLDSIDYGKERLRNPYLSEMIYFASAPNVAGMMTEDGKVIINPILTDANSRNAVYHNELSRLAMKDNPPEFQLTDRQNEFLSSTNYENATDGQRKSTIAARVMSGDPSAQDFTFEQDVYARRLRGLLGY